MTTSAKKEAKKTMFLRWTQTRLFRSWAALMGRSRMTTS